MNLEKSKSEPIAIIGLGCRFPFGADSPDSYWNLLYNSVDAITQIPKDRWDVEAYFDPDKNVPGKMYTKYGAFIEDVDKFEPEFFGISPREAACMDPQQRLLLEVSYEALERAGQMSERLAGSRTGVIIGISTDDFAQLNVGYSSPDAYSGTGTARSIAVGRLAYFFNLNGPVIQIDTACSSSLVAIHLACQNLNSGECDMALAGGINLMLSPKPFIELCRLNALSPSGRCKTFDASADGYVRGEGCGILILKKLSKAEADKDNVLAIIRGSSVNHDGRSNGLTAPNGLAQEAVIQQALENSQLKSTDIQYVEAHGTGTLLGDPIEMLSLGKALCKGRTKDNPLYVGTVKTNIGHLEAAAGVASLIKVVLSLQNKIIPPHLHFTNPNQHIYWEKYPFLIPQEPISWKVKNGPRKAGVSSFGLSGTNVHMILEESLKRDTLPPEKYQQKKCMESPHNILCLSAKSQKSLELLVKNYESFITVNPNINIADLCFSANTGRQHFEHRLAINVNSIDELHKELRSFIKRNGGGNTSRLKKDHVRSHVSLKIAFLFTGEGSQYIGMGRQLYDSQTTFHATLNRCDEILRPYLPQPLLSVLYPDNEQPALINETIFTQPALFALEYALADLWKSWGINPAIVLGHGLGEYVAACVAGVFSLEDGLKLVAERSRLMQKRPKENEVLAISADVVYRRPNLPLVSEITGKLATHEIATSDYWYSQLMKPARFAAGMVTLQEEGCHAFLEIGPNPTLLNMGRQCLKDKGESWLPSLREGKSDWQQLLSTLSDLYVQGMAIDWSGFYRDYTRKRVLLPTYPWCRNRYRLPINRRQNNSMVQPFRNVQVGYEYHPILGRRLLSSLKEIQFESRISSKSPTYLEHHQVFQTTVLPAAGYVEMAMTAGAIVYNSDRVVVEEIVIQQPLTLTKGEEKILQCIMTPEEDSKYSFKILSIEDSAACDNANWILHTSGKVFLAKEKPESSKDLLTKAQTGCREQISVDDYYQRLRERGIKYGPLFKAIQQLWQSDGKCLGQIRLPEQLVEGKKNYKIHPVLLDACFQVIGAILSEEKGNDTYLPISIGRIQTFCKPNTSVWCHAIMKPNQHLNKETLTAEKLYILNPKGELVAVIQNLVLKKASPSVVLKSRAESQIDWLYTVKWQVQNHPGLLQLKEKLSSPLEISKIITPQVGQVIAQDELKSYENLLDQLESLSIDYVLSAFRNMGWEFLPSRRFSSKHMIEQLCVADEQHGLLNRLLTMLCEEGILRKVNSQWEIVKKPEFQEPQEQMKNLLAQHPQANAELILLQRCGSRLSEVLTGVIDPLELLFPSGDMATLTKLYQDSPGAKVTNTLIQKAILSLFDRLPENQKVSFLEIGAGTGGLSSYILPHLLQDRSEYVFTDVSTLFLNNARKKFKECSFVSYKMLNIEQNPSDQGFENQKYDIIIAANVLHATRDLRKTLEHIKKLLVPGGLLILLEGIAPCRWIDLIFGPTKGWWNFADYDLRPEYPLISSTQWRGLLFESGFTDIVSVPSQHESRGIFSGQALMIAQYPGAEEKAIIQDSKRWVIFVDAMGTGKRLASFLNKKGDLCILVKPGKKYQKVSEKEYIINPYQARDFQLLFETITGKGRKPLHGVVHLWNSDITNTDSFSEEELESAVRKGCGSVLHLVQALVKMEVPQKPILWLMTCSAVPMGTSTQKLELAQSPVWGMSRVIALEYPELWGGIIDLPYPVTEDDISRISLELLVSGSEDQIVYRDGQRYVARLDRYYEGKLKNFKFNPSARYMITGGLGFLGLRLAQWMVKNGARHLVLVGRKGLPDRKTWNDLPKDNDTWKKIITIQSLEEMGAKIRLYSADVGMRTKMSKIFDEIAAVDIPLRGIFHLAGIPGYKSTVDLTLDEFTAVLHPKVIGGWLLHQLTKDMELDFFISFSSASSVWGAQGQAHYASANRFLDNLSHFRSSMGLPGLSINWGLVGTGGMVSEKYYNWLTQIGLDDIEPEQGFVVMTNLLNTGLPQITLANIDWKIFKEIYEARRERPFLEKIEAQVTRVVGSNDEQKSVILQRLKKARGESRKNLIVNYIQELVAMILGFEGTSSLDPQLSLLDLGLDSLMAVEFRNQLKTELKVDLSLERFIDGSSMLTLADFLFEHLELKDSLDKVSSPSDLGDDVEEITF